MKMFLHIGSNSIEILVQVHCEANNNLILRPGAMLMK